jgi:hypothetical protein
MVSGELAGTRATTAMRIAAASVRETRLSADMTDPEPDLLV